MTNPVVLLVTIDLAPVTVTTPEETVALTPVVPSKMALMTSFRLVAVAEASVSFLNCAS